MGKEGGRREDVMEIEKLLLNVYMVERTPKLVKQLENSFPITPPTQSGN